MNIDEEEQTTKNVESVTVNEALNEITVAAESYTLATEEFVRNFIFYEKTLFEWASSLMIEIPKVEDLDAVKFREILLQLINNIQISSNYYSVASSILDAISGGNEIKKSNLINAIVDGYAKRGAKRPAGTVIDQMADSYLANTTSATVAARIVKNFWKQRLDTLLDIRKVFEQIGMSLHVEMKLTQ
jgi:hypothetical protein